MDCTKCFHYNVCYIVRAMRSFGFDRANKCDEFVDKTSVSLSGSSNECASQYREAYQEFLDNAFHNSKHSKISEKSLATAIKALEQMAMRKDK